MAEYIIQKVVTVNKMVENIIQRWHLDGRVNYPGTGIWVAE